MPDKKSAFKYGLQILNSLLGDDKGKEKEKNPAAEPKLEDLKEEDLRQEIIRLEIEERKVIEKKNDSEKKKQDLFDEAVRNPSKNVAEINYSRSKELEIEISNYNSLMGVISKRRQVINGLVQLKIRARMLQSPMFENTPLIALIPYIEKMAEKGSVDETMWDEVIKTLNQNLSFNTPMQDDPGKADYLRAVEEARMKNLGSSEVEKNSQTNQQTHQDN